MPKLVRITTVPVSLLLLLKGQMRFMMENGFEVTMISSNGPEVEGLVEKEKCKHIAVEMTRKITPLKDLIALFQLFKTLKKIKPEIVHTHTPKAGLLGMWAALFAGVPIRMHTIAGLPWMETSGIKRFILKSMEKLTALPATAIFPNSIAQRDFLMKEKVATRKMHVLGSGSSNGIDSHFFSLSEDILHQAELLKNETGYVSGGLIWIFVGRIVKDKGIEELLDAFSNLVQSFPNDQLWLIGNDEPELDPIRPYYIDLMHNHPQIKWWGFQKDIRPFLAAAKVLVFPSYREGFPNVPLQAACMGCALILSNINGCNEIVIDGKDGLLVPVKNIPALIQTMFTLRQDELLRKQFSVLISHKIRNGYDQRQLWKIILNEYRTQLKLRVLHKETINDDI